MMLDFFCSCFLFLFSPFLPSSCLPLQLPIHLRAAVPKGNALFMSLTALG